MASSASVIATPSCRCSASGMANASDCGCSTITVHPSDGSVAATPRTDPRASEYVADADAIDHAPQLFEVQPSDEPALVRGVIETDGDDRRRQQVVIDRETREQ